MVNKKFIFFFISAIIFTGLIGAITFQQIAPTTNPFVTNESTVNLSYGIHAEDGLSSITHSWDGTNTTIFNKSSWVVGFNFDNRTGLGESNTLVYDISGNGHNGTVSSATWTLTNGRTNGGFTFDGVNDWINLTTLQGNSFVDNVASFSFWINSTLNATNRRILGIGTTAGAEGGNGLYIRFTNVNSIQVLVGDCNTGYLSLTATNVIPLNTWTKVDIVLNGTSIKTYINGTFYSDNNATTSGLCFNNTNTTITLAGGYSGTYFNGSIDDFMIFNKSLSSIEINELHKLQVTRFNQSYFEYHTTKSINAFAQPYFLCSANSTGFETCSATQTVQQTNIIVANFSDSIGIVNDAFYCSNTHGHWLGESPLIDTNSDGTKETLANLSFNRENWLNSNMNTQRLEVDLYTYANENGSFKAGFSKIQQSIKFSYENGGSVFVNFINMPDWLANKTSGYCQSTRWASCTYDNETEWKELINNALLNISNNHEYDSIISVGVLNEAYNPFFFLNNLSDSSVIRYSEYNTIYNSTYDAVKLYNFSIPVIGSSGVKMNLNYRRTFLYQWMANFSDKMDGVEIHPYTDTNYIDDNVLDTHLDYLIANCSSLGANCSTIVIAEWNIADYLIKNTSSNFNEFSSNIALGYITSLNKYPNNVSMCLYQWSEMYFENNSLIYPEHPHIWSMITQPELLVVEQPQYKASFNVTKNMAVLHPSTSVIKRTSVDTTCLQLTSSIKGNQYSLTIENICDYAINSTANLSLTNGSVFYPYTSIMNYETGASIPVSTSGIAQLGILDSYEVVYLTSGDEDGGTLVNLFRLNEYTGSVVYDALFGTSNGTRSGATWVTDGVLKTLASVTDYVFSGDGILTLTSSNIFSYLFLNWDLSSVSVLRENFSAGVDVISGKIPLLFLVLIVGVILMVLGGLTALFYLLMKKVPSRFSGGV